MRNCQLDVQLSGVRLCVIRKRVRQAMFLVVVTLLSACGMGGSSDNEYLNKAKNYLEKNEQGAAVVELKNALKQNPKNAEARFLLGKCYVSLNNGKGAEKELLLAQKYGFKNNESRALYLMALMLQGRHEDVLSDLSDSKVESGEMSDELSAMRAESLLATDQLDAAKLAIDSALKNSPQAVPLLVVKAIIDIADNQFDSSYQFIKQALQQDPEDMRAWQVKGDLNLRLKEYTEAEKAYQNILSGKQLNNYSVSRLNASLGLAKAYMGQQKFVAAKNSIADVIAVTPRHPMANYLLASINYEQENYQEALRDIQKTLRVAPKYAPANMLAGAAHYKVGSDEQAMKSLELALQGDPDSVMGRKLLATLNMKMNQPEKATDVLAPIMNDAVKDAELLALVGEAALKSGDAKKGKQYLQRASLSNPNSTAVRSGLAFAYLLEGEVGKAVAELNQNIKMNKKDIRSRIMLASTYMREKKNKEAEKVLIELREELPDSPEPLNELGKFYTLAGKEDKARDYFHQSLQKESNYIPTMMSLARLELMVAKPDAAKVLYEKILSIKPGERNALVSLAEINIRAGDVNAAITGLERARNLYPKYLVPRVILAKIYMRERNLLNLKTVVNEAVELAPSNLKVQELQGIVLLASGNAKKAMEVIGKLVKTSPTTNHYYQLAQAQRAAEMPNEALSSLAKGVKKSPDHLPSLTLMAYIYREIGRSQDAVNVYRKIIEKQPNNALVLNNVAMLSLEVDKSKALEYAKKAYKLDNSAAYADTLGWVLLKNGNVPQSLLRLNEAHDAERGNASISYHLAVALSESGQKNEAKNLLEGIVNSNQSFHESKEAKKLLATLK